MQINEPATMLTDYLLGIITFIFAIRLFYVARSRRQTSILLWSTALMAAFLAAIIGGTYHGFIHHVGDFARLTLWKITIFSIIIASYFMLAGTIGASISRPLAPWLQAAAILKLMIFAVWMATHNDFRYVIYDYASAMLAVVLLQAYAYFARREPGAKWIIAGVAASFIAAGVQQSGVQLHQHFNYNDIYHVIQIGANYLLYRGARLFKDQ